MNESQDTYRSIVINLNPRHSAISSYNPMTYLTHPSPKKTTNGKPVGDPKSDKLTVRGWSGDACGLLVNFNNVVIRDERKYLATISFGESYFLVTTPARGNSGSENEYGLIGGAVDVVSE